MVALHHLALGARDVARVSAFYSEAFALKEVARYLYDDNSLRSVWLRLDDALLMIEHSDSAPRRVDGVGAGPFLLAFSVSQLARKNRESVLESLGSPVEERTEFTSYHRDPEGNRIALSHYPIQVEPSGH